MAWLSRSLSWRRGQDPRAERSDCWSIAWFVLRFRVMKQNSTLITATWIGLNLIPLVLTVALCLLSQSWGWSLLFILLYVVAIVPYGFFVSFPFMVKFFDHPSNPQGK